jgi:hypothetical protein
MKRRIELSDESQCFALNVEYIRRWWAWGCSDGIGKEQVVEFA